MDDQFSVPLKEEMPRYVAAGNQPITQKKLFFCFLFSNQLVQWPFTRFKTFPVSVKTGRVRCLTQTSSRSKDDHLLIKRVLRPKSRFYAKLRRLCSSLRSKRFREVFCVFRCLTAWSKTKNAENSNRNAFYTG